jgi:hypothetical protein
VIEREVLLAVGKPYSQALADETARNLRDIIQLSLVIVVPVHGSAPNKVRVLVITKDVWSLRLNSDFRVVKGSDNKPKLEYLFIQPSEWNIAGTHQQVATQFIYQPLSYSVGASYANNRLFSSHNVLRGDANVIISTESGHTEGSFGSLTVGEPLWSTLTEWSWGTISTWRNEITRRYTNGELATFDRKNVPGDDAIPIQFNSKIYTTNVYVTRSYGWASKADFTLGFEASERKYTTGDLSAYDPAAVDAFVARLVPVSDARAYPYVDLHAYKTDFTQVLDFETLGLQEDFRLGHDLWLKLYPVTTGLGSTRTFMGIGGGAYYTVPFGDGLARAGVETIVEAESERVADMVIDGKQRIVTPRVGFGRLVFDGHQVFRPRDSLNRVSFLGGEGRLRGYPTNYTFGQNVVAYTLEFRTRPVEILSVQLGGALFWDTGDAYDNWSDVSLKHGAGFGMRMLFPQFDRYIFRADVGFPVSKGPRPPGTNAYEIVLTFQQAFPMPTLVRGTIFTDR